jgi:hypothetical protein
VNGEVRAQAETMVVQLHWKLRETACQPLGVVQRWDHGGVMFYQLHVGQSEVFTVP